MAEGAQAVREALARPRTVVELFVEVGVSDSGGFIATAVRANL